MLKRKLVLSDIDGTLIDSHNELQPAVIAAIRDYTQAGGHFVLASARPALGMVQLAAKLDVALPLVTLNGALIVQSDPQNPAAFTTLLQQPLASATPRRIYDLIKGNKLPISINVHAGTHWYVDAPDTWSTQEADIVGFAPETTDLSQLLTNGTPVHKILCMGEPDVIDQLANLLKNTAELDVAASRSKTTYLELTAPGVAKSSALRHLAALWHIPLEQTMAIGDGENDLPMMQAAGLGVGMGNALAQVRATLTTFVADNDHAGVAEALHKYAF